MRKMSDSNTREFYLNTLAVCRLSPLGQSSLVLLSIPQDSIRILHGMIPVETLMLLQFSQDHQCVVHECILLVLCLFPRTASQDRTDILCLEGRFLSH